MEKTQRNYPPKTLQSSKQLSLNFETSKLGKGQRRAKEKTASVQSAKQLSEQTAFDKLSEQSAGLLAGHAQGMGKVVLRSTKTNKTIHHDNNKKSITGD